MNAAVTNISSKGQVVIPNNIRKMLKLAIGSKLFVVTDGSNVLLKPIEEPAFKDFDKLMSESKAFAKRKKLKQSDLPKIIKAVRNAHSS